MTENEGVQRSSPANETSTQQITKHNFIRLGIAAFKEHELREIVAVFCQLPGVAPQPVIHAQCVPDGWRLVPITPTRKMVDRGYATRPIEECWRQMLEVAPHPPSFTSPGVRAQCAPSRIDKGRAFYLAMYEKDGAIWAANDHKGLWCDMAEDYERRISTFTSPEQYDPAFVEEIKRAAAAPPEAEFSSSQEALDYLNGIAPLPPNIQPQCAPDREALVRAIQLSYARKDLEPTSATTLALYREDAENAADAVLALTRPECGDAT